MSEPRDEFEEALEPMAERYCASVNCHLPGPCARHTHGVTERAMRGHRLAVQRAEREMRERAAACHSDHTPGCIDCRAIRALPLSGEGEGK